MRIGVLTGGGDCPGLNAVIRAVVRRGIRGGHSFLGFRHGWAGVLADEAGELTLESTAGILPRGGTILGTSRTNPYADGLDGTATRAPDARRSAVSTRWSRSAARTPSGWPCACTRPASRSWACPKTIDNDLDGTDMTFGFQTAVQIVTDAIDRLHTTAESHNRVMVVEVMGRHAGWIATHAGIAGGADAILVPERPFDIDEVAAQVRRRHARGRSFSIVVVAEGATPREGALQVGSAGPTDAFGHARLGGIGVSLEAELERRTGFESRVTILGHVQRGGTPVAFDRVLATRFGVAAMDAASDGRYGTMVALRGTAIIEMPLADALRQPKLLDPSLYETAELFFG